MASATMVAVDLGAQSGRVAVGTFDGASLGVTEVHRFDNEPYERDGTLRWDFEGLYAGALDGLRAASRDDMIDSVGVDSWAIDFGLVDETDGLLADPVHYRDPRRAAAMADVLSRIAPRELYDRTGIQLLPINTLFQLAAMVADGDQALARADRLLLVPDLVNCRLCGSRTSEFTNATTTQCFDPHVCEWAADLLESIEIPVRVFPDVVLPGTELAPVTADVARETGLGNARVVAVATHDTGSAVVAVPFRERSSVFLSVGTWSLVGLETDASLITDDTYAANLTNEGGVAGTFRLLRNVTGLWLLHECRRVWAAAGEDYSFEELLRRAESAPPLRSLVDPNADLFTEPGDMPERIRRFCRETNQPEPGDVGETARCVLESLALKHAETVDLLRVAAGVEPSELHVVGGGARNELLCAWTAEAAGLPVLAGPEEATLVGNLLVQAMALGELGSLAEAREVVRASFAQRTFEPANAERWAEGRARFASLSDEAGVEVSA
jgi:rhamnulokinase